MAFTTIPGSGAAATTIVGTSGVDFGSITSIDNYFIGAQQGGDTIGVTSNLTNGTMKGGQGNDTVTFTGGSSLSNSWLNANSNNDTIGAAGAAVANFFADSTIQGGQGTDQFVIGTIDASKVNGNKGNDTITSASAASAATLYGGQGNDQLTSTATASSTVSGDLGNDQITIGGGDQTSSTFNGGDGSDRFTINAGTAAANVFTSNTINGGAGADVINDAAGGRTQTGIVVNGDAGIDNVNLARIAASVTIDGGDDGDIITSGLAGDVVTGGAGNDNITNTGGAAGAAIGDTITGGTGADTIATAANDTAERIVQGVGDSIAATGGVTALAAGGVLAATSTFTFANGVDTLTAANTGFNGANDQLSTGIAGTVQAAANGITTVGGTNTINWTAAAAGNYIIRGTFTVGTGVFTTAGGGADLLFLQTNGGDLTSAATVGTSSLVLRGGVAGGFNSGDIIV